MWALMVLLGSLAWVDADAIVVEMVPTRATLPGTVAEMVRRLEKNDYRGLVQQCVAPKVVAQIQAEGMFEPLIAAIQSEGIGDQMKRTLRKIDWQRVEHQPGSDRAVYKPAEPEPNFDEIKFIRIDGIWYLDE